jgi:hypothetical protein
LSLEPKENETKLHIEKEEEEKRARVLPFRKE